MASQKDQVPTTAFQQPLDEFPTDVSGRTGNGNFHDRFSRERQKKRNCVLTGPPGQRPLHARDDAPRAAREKHPPTSTLSADDFRGLSSSVDAYLVDHTTVHGLLIHAKKFSGWETFAGLTAHIQFVREHHRKIKRVAFVTDSALGTVAQAVGKHFVSAEVKHFAYAEFEKALDWLNSE